MKDAGLGAPIASPSVRIRVSTDWKLTIPYVAFAEVIKDGQKRTYQGSGRTAKEALLGLAQLLAEATYMPVTHTVERVE